MMVLGLVLLVIGWVVGISLLVVLGLVLLIVGVVLMLAGPSLTGGRRYY
jgi:hypothetical protein